MRSTRDHFGSLCKFADPNIFTSDGGNTSDFTSDLSSFSCFCKLSTGFISDVFDETTLLVLDNNDCLPS